MREVNLIERPQLSAHVRLHWDPVREKQVILMPEGMLALNATAAAIVALCDGQQSVSEIIAELSSQYHRAVDEDVLYFLNRLQSKRLLELAGDIQSIQDLHG
ncbi:pyrroloquinoline quinone biosynthesis peptide chaperone PqqD [Ktedonobacteria bacterium brp13]|nr:pyrroloquinoline quinone biosynthesis peptide chaperone PqqD [Ktedonobacteria bacterium brp13]